MRTIQRLSFSVNGLSEHIVYEWPRHTILHRGGNIDNRTVIEKCDGIKTKYICYFIKDEKLIRYVGSVTSDWIKAKRGCNFSERIKAYLYRHAGNTNVRVFKKIQNHLESHRVQLGVYAFSSVSVAKKTLRFDEASNNPDIILTLEQVLLSFFRSNQSKDSIWNIQ